MAVNVPNFQGSFNAYHIDSSRPQVGAFTWCGWFRAEEVDRLQILCGRTTAKVWGPGISASGKFIFSDAGASTILGTTSLSIGVWYFGALTYDATTYRLWLGTEAGAIASEGTDTGSHDPSNDVLVFAAEYFSGFGFGGDIAYHRIWEAALSEAELNAERTSTTAVKASPWGVYAFANTASATTDTSGNSRSLTVNGSGHANATDPAIGGGGGATGRGRLVGGKLIGGNLLVRMT